MRKKDETVIPFRAPAPTQDDSADQAETCMNNIGSIITLLHETVEGERFLACRAYLVEELDKNFGSLDAALNARGTHG